MGDNQIIGLGVYTLQEASFYGSLSAQKLSRWIWGTSIYPSVIEPQLAKERLVTFYDLLQAKAIDVARQNNIPLKKIRQAIKTAQKEYDIEFPLVHHHQMLWYEGELHIKRNGIYQLSGKQKHQMSIGTIIEPYAKDLHFDKQGLAFMWTPFENKGIKISLNPKVQFGQPLVGNTGYPADVLYQSYLAENSVQGVEDEFGVSKDEVETAILYIKNLQEAA